MRRVFSTAFTIAFVAPALAQVDLDSSFPNGSGVSFEQLHAAIADKVADPRSAQYKRMRYSDQVICGLMNSKGSAGGYESFQPFLYDLADGDVMVLTEEIMVGMKGTVTRTFERVGCPLPSLGITN